MSVTTHHMAFIQVLVILMSFVNHYSAVSSSHPILQVHKLRSVLTFLAATRESVSAAPRNSVSRTPQLCGVIRPPEAVLQTAIVLR